MFNNWKNYKISSILAFNRVATYFVEIPVKSIIAQESRCYLRSLDPIEYDFIFTKKFAACSSRKQHIKTGSDLSKIIAQKYFLIWKFPTRTKVLSFPVTWMLWRGAAPELSR